MDLVKSQWDAASEAPTGQSLAKSFVDEANALPKTWFNDPYALMDSMGLGYRASPSSLSYETLKQMAEKNIIIASVIQTRVNQVASFCQQQRNKYSIGFKVQHRDPSHKMTEGDKAHVKALERFILNMGVERDAERDSFETFTRKIIRDRLIYDQVCAEKVMRRNGKPYSVYAVDAAAIRLAAPSSKRGTPLTKREAAAIPRYTQVLDGNIVNEYLRDEFIFRVANPRTDIRTYGYGYSELEMLITTVTSHLWAEEWNRKVFSQGATVKGVLNFQGKLPQAQLEAFKRQWLTQVSGVTNAWRSPVLNTEGVQWIPLQPSNNDMGYQQWLEYLIKVTCACYLIDPAEINFDTRAGVGSQPMFMTTNEAQQKVSKDRGLQPLVRFLQNVINEDILWQIDENYEFVFVGLDARTEAEAIKLRMDELGSYKTLNEVRREADDLPPVEHGDTVMNSTYVGYLNQKAGQEATAAAGGGAPGGAPAPGAPPGAPPQPGRKEMFEEQFAGGDGGAAAEKLGQAVAGQPKAKDAPDAHDEEAHSRDEVSDLWEESIHASLAEKRLTTALTDDLSKALRAFDEAL